MDETGAPSATSNDNSIDDSSLNPGLIVFHKNKLTSIHFNLYYVNYWYFLTFGLEWFWRAWILT